MLKVVSFLIVSVSSFVSSPSNCKALSNPGATTDKSKQVLEPIQSLIEYVCYPLNRRDQYRHRAQRLHRLLLLELQLVYPNLQAQKETEKQIHAQTTL